MKKNQISTILIPWYKECKRDLPWRKTNNPYYIWVSEIMLQQTRVDTVIPYFLRFIEALPTIQDLALCDEDQLNKLWQGLGYYRRVSNMKKAAQYCVEHYNGQLPDDVDLLKNLCGIGDYTAGAIASIAFNKQVSAIDGNVFRIYSRLYLIEEDITLSSTRKLVEEYIKLDYNSEMGIFNQSLMDLGATVCTPKSSAKCNECLLSELCLAYKNDMVSLLPIKKKAKKNKKLKYTVYVYRYENKVLINKRSSTGLLANLYQFEMIEGFNEPHYDVSYKHVFSHVTWYIQGLIIEVDEMFTKEGSIWVDIKDLDLLYSIPTAFKAILELL